MKRLAALAAVVAVAGLSSFAGANWWEDFDSYAAGSGLHGQGGWKGWGDDPTWDAFVTDEMSHSAPNSLDVMVDSDIVHEFEGYTSGLWTFSAWQYIPTGFEGSSYFILLNSYTDDGSNNNWSAQVRFDSSIGMVESEFEGEQLPLIFDEWVELKVEIDLDMDMQTFYYGGDMLYMKSWTEGVSGGGALNIAALDLFANGATSIYYDDLSRIPAPGSVMLLLAGVAIGGRRRR